LSLLINTASYFPVRQSRVSKSVRSLCAYCCRGTRQLVTLWSIIRRRRHRRNSQSQIEDDWKVASSTPRKWGQDCWYCKFTRS